MNIRCFFLVFFFLINSLIVSGQDSGSISVIGGSNVSFFVNSIKKYQDGITLEGWSKLRIRFNAPSTTGWNLNLRATTTQIIADSGTENLNLSFLHIRAINIEKTSASDPDYSGVPVPVDVVLNSAYQPVLSDDINTGVDLIVTISYDLGVTTPLLGKNPNFYFVDLEFQLVSY